MLPCRLCRYSFHKESVEETESEKSTMIRLVRNEDGFTVAGVRITETKDAISIDFIMSLIKRKGHGSRLVRLVQAIARKLNKPIYANVVYNAVNFFEGLGFTLDSTKKGIEELNLMTWKP